MTITHVQSAPVVVTSYTWVINLQTGGQSTSTGYSRIANIPASVAVGDIVIISALMSNASRTSMINNGWNLVSLDSVLWCRWNSSLPTSYSLNDYYDQSDNQTYGGVSIFRGAQGFRDASTLEKPYNGSYTQQPVVAPGVLAKANDVSVVAMLIARNGYGTDYNSTITATTPATNSCLSTFQAYIGSDLRTVDGTTPAYLANVQSYASSSTVLSLCLPIPALVPTLLLPIPSDIQNLAPSALFTWQHNKAGYMASASGTQESYAFRRRIGVNAYQYWNAGTASWSATIIWNASVVGSVSFPIGAWVNETNYAWSVATTENAGHNNGPFAADQPVTARTPPVVTVTAPLAVVTTPQPAIAWNVTFTNPWVAIAYQVSVFTVVAANDAAFDINVNTPVWTSGQYASTGLTVIPSVPLGNGISYRAFVRVQQTGSQWSSWASKDFLISIAAPAIPNVSATPNVDAITGCPFVNVTVASRGNILSAADASMEAGVGSWVGNANTTVSTTAVWFVNGGNSLKLTANAAGSVVCSAGVAGTYAVKESVVHTVTAVLKAPTTARMVTIGINWFGIGGVSLGSSTSSPTIDSTSANTTISFDAQSPVGAISAVPVITVIALAASETVYIDNIGIMQGSATAWSPGGYTGILATIEFTDDIASNAWGILKTGLNLVNSVDFADYTIQPGLLRTYRASAASGLYSSPVSGVVTSVLDTNSFWLIDISNTAVNMSLEIVADNDRVNPVERGIFTSIGRVARQIITGIARTQRGSTVARSLNDSAVNSLNDMLSSGHKLLLQQPAESGLYPQHIYIAATSDITVARLVQIPNSLRNVSWTWDEIEAPVGEKSIATYSSVNYGVWA